MLCSRRFNATVNLPWSDGGQRHGKNVVDECTCDVTTTVYLECLTKPDSQCIQPVSIISGNPPLPRLPDTRHHLDYHSG